MSVSDKQLNLCNISSEMYDFCVFVYVQNNPLAIESFWKYFKKLFTYSFK